MKNKNLPNQLLKNQINLITKIKIKTTTIKSKIITKLVKILDKTTKIIKIIIMAIKEISLRCNTK